jgi:hypothetical protein
MLSYSNRVERHHQRLPHFPLSPRHSNPPAQLVSMTSDKDLPVSPCDRPQPSAGSCPQQQLYPGRRLAPSFRCNVQFLTNACLKPPGNILTKELHERCAIPTWSRNSLANDVDPHTWAATLDPVLLQPLLALYPSHLTVALYPPHPTSAAWPTSSSSPPPGPLRRPGPPPCPSGAAAAPTAALPTSSGSWLPRPMALPSHVSEFVRARPTVFAFVGRARTVMTR